MMGSIGLRKIPTGSVVLLLVYLIILSMGAIIAEAAYEDNCHEHCIHCSAEDGGKTCKMCRHNLYLYNGTCVSKCPSGYKETAQHINGDQGAYGRERGLRCQDHLLTGNVLVAVGEDKMGGVPPYPVTNVVQFVVAINCVAALSSDGTVKAWGNYYLYGGAHCGGVAPPNLKNVTQLYASGFGVCALHVNTSVTCWGSEGGSQSQMHWQSSVGTLDKDLTNIKRLFSTKLCFIAVDNTDKVAHCWGDNNGHSPHENHCCAGFNANEAINVDTVITNDNDFVVIRKDKTMYSFGVSFQNGDGARNYRGWTNVKTVVSAARNGFIAILEDGTVDAWGQQNEMVLGTHRTPVPTTTPHQNLLVNIKHVYVNQGAFVALKNDGTIAHAWGNKNHGGCGDTNECTSSNTAPPNLGGKRVVNVVSTSSAFVLMLEDTEVLGFGRLGYGGDVPPNTKCISVVGSYSAVACIQPNTILVAWPKKDPNEPSGQNYGGDVTHYSPAKTVTAVKSGGSLGDPNVQHFIALTTDKKAIAWGQDPSSTIPASFTASGQNLIEVFALLKAYIAIKNCFGEYYADSNNMCQHCPDGYSSNDGASNVGLASCKACSPGYYRVGTTVTCQPCERSKYSLNEASKECNQNTPGFYLYNCYDSDNFIGCGAMNECERGKMCNGTGAMVECPLGKYQGTQANQKCDDCPTGRFVNVSGALDCIKCEKGKMSSTAGASSCKFCPDGEVPDEETRSICIKCLAGEYMNIATRLCDVCPSGHSCKRGTVTPEICAKGEYAPLGSADCQRCDLGKFNPLPKQSECLDCFPGKYQDDKGKDSCKDCRVDTFSNARGNVAPEKCAKCLAVRPLTNTGGKTGAITEDSCGCETGTYLNRDAVEKSSLCVECPVGSSCKKFNNSIATIGTQVGYWRSSKESLAFHSCEDLVGSAHCLGGDALNQSQCREGHEGPLCSVCKTGFIRQGGVCQACGNDEGVTGIATPVVGSIFLVLFSIAISYQYMTATKSVGRSTVKNSVLEENLMAARNNGSKVVPPSGVSAKGGETEEDENQEEDAEGEETLTNDENGAGDDDTIGGVITDGAKDTMNEKAEETMHDGEEVGELDEEVSLNVNTRSVSARLHEIREAIDEFYSKVGGLAKIFVSFIQIFTHLAVTFTIPWPKEFLAMTNWPIFKVLNIDFAAILGAVNPCTMYTPFLQRFVYHICLMPILIFILLFFSIVIGVAVTKCKQGELERRERRAINQKMLKLINVIVFLMYPGLSVKIFSVFKCVEVDSGEFFLANDMSIQCFKPLYNSYATVAVICVAFYVIGIPTLSLLVLYKNRKIISSSAKTLKKEKLDKSIGNLYAQYKPKYYWWECLEMVKKMMLTGGLILLSPGSSAQILLGILVVLMYLCLVLKYSPYNEDDDDFLQNVATGAILLTLIGGLALRADDAGEGYYESKVMGSLFIFINVSIFVAFAYTFARSTAGIRGLIAGKKKQGPRARNKLSSVLPDEGSGFVTQPPPSPKP